MVHAFTQASANQMLMNHLTCVSGVVKRIIPAVASTNAVIAGMLTLQMFSGFGMLERFLIFFSKLSCD